MICSPAVQFVQVLALGVDDGSLSREWIESVLGDVSDALFPVSEFVQTGFEGASSIDPVFAVDLLGCRDEPIAPLGKHLADRFEVNAIFRPGSEDPPVQRRGVHRVPVEKLVGPLVVRFVDHRAVVQETVRILGLNDDVVLLVAVVLADPELRLLPGQAVVALRVAHARLGGVAGTDVPHAEQPIDSQDRAVQARAVPLPRELSSHHRLRVLLRLMPDPLYPYGIV